MDLVDQAMVLSYREAPGSDEVSERNRALLVDALERLSGGDTDAWWAIYDPEVTFHEASCLPYGGAHRGLEATKTAFGQLSDTFSDMKSVMEAVLASRDLCILYQTITVTSKDAGVTVTFPVCEVFRFRNGKVIEWRACYFDACLMAKAINGG
jgi:ketosteroid isomerase-like protein